MLCSAKRPIGLRASCGTFSPPSESVSQRGTDISKYRKRTLAVYMQPVYMQPLFDC